MLMALAKALYISYTEHSTTGSRRTIGWNISTRPAGQQIGRPRPGGQSVKIQQIYNMYLQIKTFSYKYTTQQLGGKLTLAQQVHSDPPHTERVLEGKTHHLGRWDDILRQLASQVMTYLTHNVTHKSLSYLALSKQPLMSITATHAHKYYVVEEQELQHQHHGTRCSHRHTLTPTTNITNITIATETT